MAEEQRTDRQLEQELSGHRSGARVGKVVAYAGGLGAILGFASGLVPVGVVCLLIALVGGYQMSKHTETLKKTLSSEVVTGVLGEVFENVDYNPFGRLDDETVKSAHMVFPFAFERVGGSDCVRAIYKGLNIALSDVELSHVEDYYDEEKGQWEEKVEQVFKGQWLVCDFGKALSGEVHLSTGTKSLRKQLKNEMIPTDSEAFNTRFLVTAGSGEEAFYILTPHMMDYILSAAGKSGGEVYMSFLKGGKLHIAVKSGRDFFELGKSQVDLAALRQKFLGEIRWFTGIIDELRLTDGLYEKESVG